MLPAHLIEAVKSRFEEGPVAMENRMEKNMRLEMKAVIIKWCAWKALLTSNS